MSLIRIADRSTEQLAGSSTLSHTSVNTMA
jgi:hypothetical protein